MSLEFYQTRAGRKFYEADVPEIAEQLKRIANSLEVIASSVDTEKPVKMEQLVDDAVEEILSMATKDAKRAASKTE